MAVIDSLAIYPVKSLRGIDVNCSNLQIQGLQYDRNWMIVDSNGEFVTQRELESMSQIQVSIEAETLTLHHSTCSPLAISLTPSEQSLVTVKVWEDICKGYDEGSDASKWITAVLGMYHGSPLRIVRFNRDCKRPVDPRYMKGDSSDTAFSDGYPFLIATTMSLQSLNEQLSLNGSRPVTMDRFRANIVLRDTEPFEEDRTEDITSIDNRYRITIRKPCQRCKITTIDQSTGEILEPKEPLRTLSKMNRYTGRPGAFFGQNATLTLGENETIRVGDQLILS